MSLLMDALKRAEASKQQVAGAAPVVPPGDDGLALEPLATAPASQLPELAAHIDSVDAELASSPQHAEPATPPATPRGQPAAAPDMAARAAARNAFAAKQGEETPGRGPLWLVLGTLGLAAAGIGAYVWYQVNALGGGSLAPPPPAPVARAPAPAPATAAVAVPAIALSASPVPVAAPAVPPVFATPPASTATAATPAPGAAGDAPRRAAPPEQGGTRVPIRLTRERPPEDGAVHSAYAKLQTGQLDGARTDYEKALREDPNNTDALLGLAAIAQRQGRFADAERYQQRALEADPRNPAAQAATLSGGAAGDPATNESRLKSALAAQPESGPLNFALGNLYARQGRWPEAQQAYFDAVASEPDNPDYLYNLAVALDQLRQPKLAAQHYRLAEDAAQRRPASFDPERLRARLAVLQP
jgi:tetratricopeptide (TPR) repeat protein